MTFRTRTTIALAVGLVPAAAARADFDVSPSVVNGRIVTNAYTDEGPSADNNYTPFVPDVRVLDFDLGGDDPSNPFFAQDPGFHPLPGSGFTAAGQVRVGAVSTLSYYSGSGPVAFTPAPSNLTLDVAYGSGSLNVTGTTDPAGTLLLGTPSAAGDFDRHLGSTLISGTTADPADGLYLVELQVSDPAEGFAPSAPAYVLYRLNADDAVVDATKVYLRDTFAPGTNLAPPTAVPEPTTAAAVGFVAAGALARRRRR